MAILAVAREAQDQGGHDRRTLSEDAEGCRGCEQRERKLARHVVRRHVGELSGEK
jgi:hypothetical protein